VRKLVAGQEDIILEEAHQLAKLTGRKEIANGEVVECL
jgi:hypothetical protein